MGIDVDLQRNRLKNCMKIRKKCYNSRIND